MIPGIWTYVGKSFATFPFLGHDIQAKYKVDSSWRRASVRCSVVFLVLIRAGVSLVWIEHVLF